MPKVNICAACQWWGVLPNPDRNSRAPRLGSCRAYAPQGPIPEKVIQHPFPVTKETDWCRDFEQRED